MNALVSNLQDGLVPAAQSCFASDHCGLKYGGSGCPVCDGKTMDTDFSCGAARAFAIAARRPTLESQQDSLLYLVASQPPIE